MPAGAIRYRRRMHTRLVIAVAALAVVYAGAASAAGLRITIVSAKIDTAKLPPGGQSRATTPYSDLACYALPGLRAMARSCGVQVAADGVTVLPAEPLAEKAPVDPLVRLEFGANVVRTYPVPSTLSPKWDYSVVVDEAVVKKAEGRATLILYDWRAAGVEVELGRAAVKLRPGEHTAEVGPGRLVWRVERLKRAAPRVYAYDVPATRQIADLAREAPTTQKADEYVAVPVSEGEIVEIAAFGFVQPNARKYPKRTAGPEGIPTISTKVQYNQPGFRDGQHHAALIAQLGTKSMMVGKATKFTARTAGLLVLAINDLKTSDNGGAFAVKVTVRLPDTDDASALKRSGSAADTGPASLSPRVIQQIVDSRTAEFTPCFAKTADPNGDVTLQFLITSDGRPVVTVANASPNLADTSECMAEKAGAWRFPRPRGTVVVRYPMHLSAG